MASLRDRVTVDGVVAAWPPTVIRFTSRVNARWLWSPAPMEGSSGVELSVNVPSFEMAMGEAFWMALVDGLLVFGMMEATLVNDPEAIGVTITEMVAEPLGWKASAKATMNIPPEIVKLGVDCVGLVLETSEGDAMVKLFVRLARANASVMVTAWSTSGPVFVTVKR